jgi:WD40 repeat protein
VGRVDGLLPGDPGQIGPFRLLGRLGQGGMGRVFLGSSPGGRRVAIKIVHPHYADDPEFRRRFAREVAAARRVGGFHTALVVDADPNADPPWMATAYVPGPSLASAVAEQGPLAESAVRELGAALAEGLAAIHACGIIHRDLKPGNVILADDGPRIIDFGIAKGTDATELTASHAVIGSLRYMSPEQLNDQELTAQSDVFALGTVLAYAATGRDPFAAPTVPAVINRILNDPPKLEPLTGDLRAIIADCLAKEPGNRPTTGDLLAHFTRSEPHDQTVIGAREPAVVVEPATAPPEPVPTPPEPVPAEPEPVPAEPEPVPAAEPSQDSTINVAVAARQPAPESRTAQSEVAATTTRPSRPARNRRRAGLIAAGSSAVIALAVVAALALSQHPARTLSATGTRASTPPATGTRASVSPSAAHSHPASRPPTPTSPATLASATGSLIATLTPPSGANMYSLAFSPKGPTLAVSDLASNLYLWNPVTRKITATLAGDPDYRGDGESVAFSPNGTTLAFGGVGGKAYLWNVATREITATLIIPNHDYDVDSLAFSPNGTTLAVGADDSSTYLWNLATRKLTATFFTGLSGNAVSSVAFSPNGSTIATGNFDGRTYLWNVATQKNIATLIDPGHALVQSVAFSPNGTSIATAESNGKTYLWNVATKKNIAIFTGAGIADTTAVVFSPNGYILATANAYGGAYLWNVATRALIATLAVPGTVGTNSVAFTSDGGTLATADYDGSTYLWHITYSKS